MDLALNSSVSITITKPQKADEISNTDTPDAVIRKVNTAASLYCWSYTEPYKLAPIVPNNASPANVAISAAGKAANKLTTAVAPSPAIILKMPADKPAIYRLVGSGCDSSLVQIAAVMAARLKLKPPNGAKIKFNVPLVGIIGEIGC